MFLKQTLMKMRCNSHISYQQFGQLRAFSTGAIQNKGNLFRPKKVNTQYMMKGAFPFDGNGVLPLPS